MIAAGLKAAMFISFDAVSVSGITVEATKVAKKLKENGFRCYLDLGYDINISKGNFGKPYVNETCLYHNHFELVRVDITTVPNYTPEFIKNVNRVLLDPTLAVSHDAKAAILASVDQVAAGVALKIVALWKRLNVSKVIVENGTLPENIVYSRALRLAIEQYGQALNLGSFVIWRDHDLMWSSEKKVMKYGVPPYPHAIKPAKSQYITYVTLNEKLRNELETWCNFEVEVKVRKNTYDFSERHNHSAVRELLHIGRHDILIARTTRLIPQKRIDRDIVLVQQLNQRFRELGESTSAILVVAGDKHENYPHYLELVRSAQALGISQYIEFVGPLYHDLMPSTRNLFTIEDLYYSCDLVSFLTSYDYDSYGNPIGEAISQKRCYITTSYEYYDEVYGRHGFEAPVLEISSTNDGLPGIRFIDEVFRLLSDKQLMKAVAERNFKRGKRVLSNNVFDVLNLNDCD
ncbi:MULTISPECIES: hypothetical protein [unclassified Sinorhizobium]|uniref:hypothetical protein n=1 Tax=unclassified Sinorhizobium TaxID=2613772 RepID=UPI0024C39841|nr:MULTISPECIES: hypothetical protein [unclassified Sinorhizobium]MDK1378112.1 hypothetical protein [Sinorhizobium sp. 6-70]MDK1481735.1 hypothetical protein [Sinorhizobium sp. 6-117]